MTSPRIEDLSPFGRLAVQLDGDMSELDRLSAQIQRLNIQSESELDHALKLLGQFAQHGQNIAGGMKDFSKLLIEAHQQSDVAARAVAERAHAIHERQRQRNQIREKMGHVEQDLRAASEKLAGFKKEGKKEFSDEEKRRLSAALEQLDGELDSFVSSAEAIKTEASEAKFKTLERNAQSLLDTLQASRRKIQQAISR